MHQGQQPRTCRGAVVLPETIVEAMQPVLQECNNARSGRNRPVPRERSHQPTVQEMAPSWVPQVAEDAVDGSSIFLMHRLCRVQQLAADLADGASEKHKYDC